MFAVHIQENVEHGQGAVVPSATSNALAINCMHTWMK